MRKEQYLHDSSRNNPAISRFISLLSGDSSAVSARQLLSPEEHQAILDACADPSTKIVSGLSDQFGKDIASASKAISDISQRLTEQAQKLDDHIAAQKAKQDYDDAQKILELKEQRRHEWRIALVSAALGAIFSLLAQHAGDFFIFLGKLFQ